MTQPMVIEVPSQPISIKRKDALMLFPDELIPNDTELRARAIPPTADDIERMADSLAKYGQLQDILVRLIGDRYRVVDGETRRQAFVRWNERDGLTGADRRRIRCAVTLGSEAELFEKSIVANNERNLATPIDNAQNIRILMDRFGKSAQAVADIYKKSAAWVTETLRLLDLDEDKRLAIHSGVLNAAAGITLSKVEPEKRAEVMQRAEVIAIERESKRRKPVDISTGIEAPANEPERSIVATTPEDALLEKVKALKATGKPQRISAEDIRLAARQVDGGQTFRPKLPEIRGTFEYVAANGDRSFPSGAVNLAKLMLKYLDGKELDSVVFAAFHNL